MVNSILFLTLKIFSATGGIEKVCRVAGKALHEISEKSEIDLSVYSMYDNDEDIIEKYFPKNIFSGFGMNKSRFVFQSIMKGRKQDVVILSHVNLIAVGFLIKLFSPKTRLILIAHGIEVWKSFSPVKKMMLRKCDLILPVSDFTKETMIQLNGFERTRFSVFNNCLDPFLPAPLLSEKDSSLLSRYGFNNENKIILTLTRISDSERYKGYDNVLLAVKKLIPEHPSLRYLIVGKYDAIEKKRIDKIIADLNIKDFVVFAGFIPDEEIATHFNLADVYVMPSKKEGFGIVFIEAMHYGIPVIAGNKDGSVDALDKGNLGTLVDPDNLDEIVHGIDRILADKSKYKPNHELLMKRFSFETYQKNLEEIILH